MGYLANAVKFLNNLGYETIDKILDERSYPFAYEVKNNNKNYYLLAIEKFYYIDGLGICKSLDKELVDLAKKQRKDILLYVHKPSKGHDPNCYLIQIDILYNWCEKLKTERFGKFINVEERKKYDCVPLAKIGMKNIRADMARSINEGESFWLPKLRELGFIYVGDQFGDSVYDKTLGWCPDFIHILGVAIEEGKHSRSEENRRKSLALKNNINTFFIPYNVTFYKRNPEAVRGVLDSIKDLLLKKTRRNEKW